MRSSWFIVFGFVAVVAGACWYDAHVASAGATAALPVAPR
jgi:hypothetical protein